MKTFLALCAFAILFSFNQASASELSFKTSDGKYTCIYRHGSVCMMNNQTRRCTHEWNKYDVFYPMAHCRRVADHFSNPKPTSNDYRCVDRRYYACAANIRTGQCAHTWMKYDYMRPMDQCERFLGRKPIASDSILYRCQEVSGRGVCAMNSLTNRCKKRFNVLDYPNPMRACMKYLSR